MTCAIPGCERRAAVVVVTRGIARSVCPIHASHPQEPHPREDRPMSPKLDAAAQDSRREKVAAWCRQVGLDPDEIPAPTGARNDTTATAVDEGHIEVTYRTFLRKPDGEHRGAIDSGGAYFIELSEPLVAVVTEAPPGFRSLTWSAWEWITTGDRGRPETK